MQFGWGNSKIGSDYFHSLQTCQRKKKSDSLKWNKKGFLKFKLEGMHPTLYHHTLLQAQSNPENLTDRSFSYSKLPTNLANTWWSLSKQRLRIKVKMEKPKKPKQPPPAHYQILRNLWVSSQKLWLLPPLSSCDKSSTARLMYLHPLILSHSDLPWWWQSPLK